MSDSARKIPVAAAATVGLFSCARRMASAKVTRMVGEGGCANTNAVAPHAPTVTTATAQTKCNHEDTETRRRGRSSNHFVPSCLGGCIFSVSRRGLVATAPNALHDDSQHRNKREIQARRRDHAAGHRGAAGKACLPPGAAG